MIEIYNEDAYKKIKDIADKTIDCIIIDPPYDIPHNNVPKNYEKKLREVSRIDKSRIIKTIQIKDMSNGMDFDILKQFERILKKINIFIFCNKTLLFKLINYYNDDKYYKEVLVWCKTNPTPLTNGTFLPDIEYIFYVRDKGVKLRGTMENKHKWYIQQANINDKKLYLHPTIKPQNILQNLILVSTDKEDTILDCFMGSGSTGIACMRTKRNFIGIELEKKYFDIAKKRIENEEKQISVFDYL